MCMRNNIFCIEYFAVKKNQGEEELDAGSLRRFIFPITFVCSICLTFHIRQLFLGLRYISLFLQIDLNTLQIIICRSFRRVKKAFMRWVECTKVCFFFRISVLKKFVGQALKIYGNYSLPLILKFQVSA